VSDASPRIDFDNLPAPSDRILVTLFLTVRDTAASCDFYSRVLGGTVVLEGTPSMVKLSNSRIIMNSGGGPTPQLRMTSTPAIKRRHAMPPRRGRSGLVSTATTLNHYPRGANGAAQAILDIADEPSAQLIVRGQRGRASEGSLAG
jgi:hypothetical protein